MTKREFYKAVAEANISDEITEYANKAIENLDKTNEKRKSKKSKEQAETDAKVLATMTTDFEKAKAIAERLEFTVSRVVASCKRLEAEGKVRIELETKGSRNVATYALVETDEGETTED